MLKMFSLATVNEKNEREKLMRNNVELSLQLDKAFGMK